MNPDVLKTVAILCLSPGIGGLELYAYREYQALSQKGVKCIVVVAKGSRLAKYFHEAGVEVYELSITFRRLPLLSAWRLAEHLQRNKVDIVHIHWGKDLVLAMLAKKKYSFHLVYTRHMEITRPKKDFFHRIQYQAVNKLLTITENMRHQAINFLPLHDEQIECLYLGVAAPNTDTPSKDFFPETTFPKRNLDIALFGRVEHGKGQHLLIEAVISLLDQGRDISVTLIGYVMDQDYKQQLQKLIIERSLGSRIRFIDFMQNPIDSMTNFDVVVLATYKETFGLVLPEAMRAGIPVIGSNAGGVPEIIDDGENGLLFSPGDSISLATAISRYYDDPVYRSSLAKKGQKKADKRFSDTLHFEKLKHLLLCHKNSAN